MILILEDPHTYQSPPPDALTAAETTDYVPVRIAIRRALDSHTHVTVHVTSPLLVHWLKDLRIYPPDVVTWETVDPTEEFITFFGFAPPVLFTPALIVQLELASLTPPPLGTETQTDPIAWILRQKLDDVWSYTTIYPNHLAQLALWTLSATQQTTPIPDYLHPLIQEQLNQWATQDVAYSYLHTTTLREECIRLLLHSILHRYDKQWLQQQGWHTAPIRQLESAPELADLLIELLSEYQSPIATYWQRTFATTTQSPASCIATALDTMSGFSMSELHTLETFLHTHPTILNADLVRRIEERFTHLLHLTIANDVIQDLHTRIAPPEPPMPEVSWTVAQWFKWATQDYMPYFAWTIRHGQPRTYQETCASAFADWLAEAYPAWLNAETSPLVMNQYQQIRQSIDATPHALVVWLIVDGLTWWQGEHLRTACEQHGLYAQSQTVGIAALPSITSVSKRMLVTGLPATKLEPVSIAQTARQHLERSGIPEHHVCYSMQEGFEMLQKDTSIRCLVVLFNMLDTVAHETRTFTDNAGIRGYIKELADGLAKYKQLCHQRGQALHIFIGSDHGSTLLPDNAPSLPLPHTAQEVVEVWDDDTSYTSYASLQAEKRSPRAVTVANPQHLALDTNTNRAHWYVLDCTRYQLAQHYLVPRGYAYVGHRPMGWTHGGLTPEEVIVPLLYLTPQPLQIQPVEIYIEGMLRANQQTTLKLNVVNLNYVLLEAVHMQIDGGPECCLSLPTIEHIAALHTHSIDVAFPPIVSRDTALHLQWKLTCRIAGLPHHWQGQQHIPIRRLQVEDTSIDDFFDEM